MVNTGVIVAEVLGFSLLFHVDCLLVAPSFSDLLIAPYNESISLLLRSDTGVLPRKARLDCAIAAMGVDKMGDKQIHAAMTSVRDAVRISQTIERIEEERECRVQL